MTIRAHLTWYNDQSNSNFNNAGTVTEAVTSGTTTFDVAFNDSGNLAVQSGTLALESGSVIVNGSGLLSCDPGATITLGGNLLGNTQDADLFNPQGTVLLSGSGTSAAPSNSR